MRLWHALAVLGIMSFVADVASAAEGVKLVVVPAKGKGGANVQAQISALVEKPLGSSTSLITFTNYQKAGRIAGVRHITGPEAVVPAGRGAGATHVLILESQADKGAKKKKGGAIAATLIDVSTGETLLSKKYSFTGKKLSGDVAGQIVRDVNQSLQRALTPPTPAIEAPPPPPPPTPAAPQPPVASNAPSAPPDIVPPPMPAAPVAPATPMPSPDAPMTPPPPAEALVANETPAPAAVASHRVRPGLRLDFGAIVYMRTANIDAGATASNPPCYCEPTGVSAPVFSRMDLRAELFPFSFGGDGSWYEGFGLHFDGSLGFPRTNLGNGNVVTSNSGEFSGGIGFRYVLWDSILATDLTAKFGYWTYSFPLNGAVFPGVGFESPYAGLNANIPLGMPELALELGGMYGFREISFGGAQNFGQQTTSTGAGNGLHLEGGVRATFFDTLEITGLFFFEQFSATYSGPTNFALTNVQYNDVSVTDKLLGGVITAGFAL